MYPWRMDSPRDPVPYPMPRDIEPMLAKAGPLPRDDSAYAFEIKCDGVRAVAYVHDGQLRLQSRNQNDTTKTFPELHGLADTLAGLAEGRWRARDEGRARW